MGTIIGITLTLAIVGSFLVYLFVGKKGKKNNMDANTVAQPATQTVDPMEVKIKDKFKLFQGVRSQDEDQNILEKVSDMCFNEMLLFVAENLTDEQRASFETEAEKAENDEVRNKVFTDYVSKIPNYQTQLNERMDKYLDKIIETSLNAQKL